MSEQTTLHDVAVEIKSLSYENMKELGKILFSHVHATLENNGDRDKEALGEFSWNFFSDTLFDWAAETIKQQEQEREAV